MTALPGLPAHVVIALRLEVPPELLAVIAELTASLRPLISLATNFPGGVQTPPGSTASAASVAGSRPATARVDSSPNLPPAATHTAPPPALSGGEVKRGNRHGTFLKDAANWRTPERAAVVRRCYPAGDPIPHIRAELNTLPGPQLTKKEDIANWAFSLGLRRPPGTLNRFLGKSRAAPDLEAPPVTAIIETPIAPSLEPPPAVISTNLDVPGIVTPSWDEIFQTPAPTGPETAIAAAFAAATPRAPETDAAPAQPDGDKPPPLPTWTADRIALLKRDYRGRPLDTILAAINALPGAFISASWMHNYATAVLKLPRREDVPTPPPPTQSQRKRADRATIKAFCGNRGWKHEPFDLDAINRECTRLGHPGFELVEPPPRVRQGDTRAEAMS